MEFERLSQRYKGETARNYDAQRQEGAKWRREEKAIEILLKRLPRGLKTLDVPVGTGRLFPYYKLGDFDGTGVDVSRDMLAEAEARASALDLKVDLKTGDIRALPFANSSFDLVMCIRFLNWVDRLGFEAALSELARVSRRHLLVGIRHLTPLGDLRPTARDTVRLIRRMLGHAQTRARRSGLVYHEKAVVSGTFAVLGASVVESALVEKRSDGTDYYIYLLEKSGNK
jgi:SAM-dependent methyltransferase